MDDFARLAAALADSDRLPWIPVTVGVSSKPLAFFGDNNGWVSLLRLEPGAHVPPHRHQGEVHGFVLAGRRRLGPQGAVIGPGDYAFEPAGHADTWSVDGDEPLISLFVVRGSVEYLDDAGRALRQETTASKADGYRRYCAEQGLTTHDLYR